jgi:hypothetical protein
MELEYFNLLEFLKSNGGLNKKISIKPLIEEIISYDPTFRNYQSAMEQIWALLGKLNQNQITKSEFHRNPSAEFEYNWELIKDIKVELTPKGYADLTDHLQHESELKLNKLLIENQETAKLASQSVINTNESIVATNKKMLEHTERQEKIMEDQKGFSRQQTGFLQQQVTIMDEQKTLVGKQNSLYKFTLYLTGANILVAVALLYSTINSNADKQSIATLQSQLEAQRREIKQLQFLKSDTVHYVLHYPISKNKATKK